MKHKMETWLYIHELRDYWKVETAIIRRWGRDGILPSLSSAMGRLFHKDDIAKFEKNWPNHLLHAQVQKEVEDIRKTQMELDFCTTIHMASDPFGDIPDAPRGPIVHKTKRRKRTLPRI